MLTKGNSEVVGESLSPSAPKDKPSSAVEVHNPKEAKDATNDDDRKMPAIEKDKALQGAKTRDVDQKDDGVLHTSTTPVANLPSGLDVIANAAANVDVQVHPAVEVIVIDDVPEVRAVSVSSIDASVYSFLGAKELFASFEETMNTTLTAKQRVQENLNRQRKLLKTFNKI